MWQTFIEHPLLYLSMPFVSAFVGWGTNVLAIKMAFEPKEFIGKPPILGWQGVIPRMAEKFATMTVDTMSAKLLDMHELFSKFDAGRVTEIMEPYMLDIIEDMLNDVMMAEIPNVWEALPIAIKKQIYNAIKAEAPDSIHETMEDIKNNIEEVFDLRTMLITNLVKDIDVLCNIFERSASQEMKFIAKSGVYFGFPLGILQMFVWMHWQDWYLVPLFGALCGYVTNVLALHMIFEPKKPVKIGPFTMHGLFFRRQDEIAAEQGMLIAKEILNPERVIEGILKGPSSDRLFKLIHKNVKKAIDEYAGLAKPLMLATVGTERFIKIKNGVIEKIFERAQDIMKPLHAYTYEALDVENLVREKVKLLSPEDFESMIRPIFQEDEWIMTGGGAVLGIIVGFLQLGMFFF
ncbi:MAG: DUF445 domain-containing protein [SAR324 cluster bacterium]|nr:DUF445 domain-containing protein [SAR324 cluster bacterium]